MDFGFHCGVYSTIHKDAAMAEERGFTHALLYDSQMIYGDVFAGLCVCATNTKKLKLGPGVTNPASRIAPATASAIATVNVFAPGRAVLGIGTGNSTRRTLGMPATKLSELRECVEVCRGLLDGKQVLYREGDRRREIRFLNPEGALNIKDRIPIYISGAGPKALELAGEIGDGVILWGISDENLIKYHLDHARRGAERAGRKFEDLYVICMTACHVTKPGESLESIRAAVGYMAISGLNLIALSVSKNPEVLPAEFRADIMGTLDAYRTPGESIERRHLERYTEYGTSLQQLHESMVTERLMKATSIVGSPQECVETIKKMERAGVHQVTVQIGNVNQRENLIGFSKAVIENY
ncbi:MAG: LLM class flavin-dependent oxidoreductase [Candidatus Binataceae bacterium]|jgi:alkanesulfonate monooxygenase SsuD/methylene tetrahydromethanopterin reductase-like flavin-dependent oxidoreductase (luciferase family)